ncbi:MAG: late competence development ComFB family protein, partial [Coleofasciculaceae cyanobacterium RL_1_1]|nr:late competence development ComFB family protein [Coleofasciculaceae cyanobacterium RL_1_1]
MIGLTYFTIVIDNPRLFSGIPSPHRISLFPAPLSSNLTSSTPMASQPTYRNVMEALVIEALEHRLYELPIDHQAHCDLNDAIAYALNRLPAVYTTNEITWTR